MVARRCSHLADRFNIQMNDVFMLNMNEVGGQGMLYPRRDRCGCLIARQLDSVQATQVHCDFIVLHAEPCGADENMFLCVYIYLSYPNDIRNQLATYVSHRCMNAATAWNRFSDYMPRST